MRFAILLALATTSAAAAPRLVPVRDVAVQYSVQPRGHGPLDVRVTIEGGGRHLRVESAELPTVLLVDRPAGQATILLPILKLYATVGIGRFDPERGVLRDARFERGGQERVAGLACTDWTARSGQGTASACITPDGVILRGMARDGGGMLATLRASAVQYAPAPAPLFRMPEGYRRAGSLPVEGFER